MRDYQSLVTLTTVSNVTLAVGGVTAAAGLTWLLVSTLRGEDRSRSGASAFVAPTQGGLTLGLGGSL